MEILGRSPKHGYQPSQSRLGTIPRSINLQRPKLIKKHSSRRPSFFLLRRQLIIIIIIIIRQFRFGRSTMGLPLLFFLLLVLAAVAPRLLVAKTVSNSAEANMFAANITSKPSMIWTNNKVFLAGSGEQTIVNHYIQGETNFKGADIEAGFACVSASSPSPCDDEFFFAVSIQYLESGTSQIIWTANRACPVRNNATLEFTSDGTLALHDADGSHVWSSSSSGRSVAGMLITEIGNLVLFDQRNETVWQSFDHPTDTLVPGQSLLEGTRLAANTSATNMTENQLYIIVRPDGLYAYAGSTPPQLYFSFNYLVADPKKENDPSNVTFMNGILSISVQSDRYNNSSITLPETESTQYIRLDSDGHLRLYQWSDTNRNWNMFDVLSMQDCAYPIACGEYGVCNAGQCTCPHQENFTSAYFVPVDDEKSNLGCAPITQISCQELQHHKLLTISDMSYFDKKPTVVNATSISDCKQACLKNCSCKAVMFSYHHNDSDGRCDWLTEVFSLKSTQPETIGYNSSAYLKVQLSPSSNKIKVMFIVIGALLGLLPVVVLSHSLFTKEEKERRQDEEFDFDQLPGMPERFSLAKLNECTEGFSKKLGEGGFGSVFEGKLGEERIAVKRLEGARQGKKEFLTEVETIGSIDHINLVGLIGFCAQKSERLLVYEYMPRGSLDRWIYYRHNNNPLDWCTRCRIILDIAKGLCYLHEQCRRKIAHLDIKPQNILLDDNFNAKVADFGLCKLINRDQSNVVTVMRGTPGYLAPEWLTSRITEKVDVYSFGVVLMEILSGRKNIDNFQPEEDVQLISLLQEKAQNNQFMDLIDKHGDDLVLHQEEVIQMMKLAMWCLQNDSNQRPSMSTVIKVLEGAVSVEAFDAKSIMFVQDNPSTYSSPTQASILSGPR